MRQLITLDPHEASLANRAIEWYVRDGIADDRVRAVALGAGRDTEFDAMKKLRARLREVATIRVVIGRHAHEMLREVQWDDAQARDAVESVRGRASRVEMSVTREVAALFAAVLDDAADEALADGGLLDARRFRQASEQFREALKSSVVATERDQ